MKHPTLPFDPTTSRLIRAKARRLSRRPGFSRLDYPDIVQDLAVVAYVALQRFDPSRGDWVPFLIAVLDRAATSLIRHRWAAKRTPNRQAFSINDVIEDADGRTVQRHETMAGPVFDSVEAKELRAILRRVLRGRPFEEQEIARRIGEGASIRSLARERQESRQSIRRKLRLIGRALRDGGRPEKSA